MNVRRSRITTVLSAALIASAISAISASPAAAQTLNLNGSYTARASSPGLWLKNPGYIGVRGDAWYGLMGNAGPNNGIGVFGNNDYDGCGVEGDAVNGTGGFFTSVRGCGIHTYSKGSLPTIFVENQAGGPSALFHGNVTVEGLLSCGCPHTDPGSKGGGHSIYSDIVQGIQIVGQIFSTFSSERWKHDIQPISGLEALKKVQQLQGVRYTWNADHGSQKDMGFIAEQVAKVDPLAVVYEKDGKTVQGIKVERLNALIVEAVKEQQKQFGSLQHEFHAVRAIQSENVALKAKLAVQEARLVRLEKAMRSPQLTARAY